MTTPLPHSSLVNSGDRWNGIPFSWAVGSERRGIRCSICHILVQSGKVLLQSCIHPHEWSNDIAMFGPEIKLGSAPASKGSTIQCICLRHFFLQQHFFSLTGCNMEPPPLYFQSFTMSAGSYVAVADASSKVHRIPCVLKRPWETRFPPILHPAVVEQKLPRSWFLLMHKLLQLFNNNFFMGRSNSQFFHKGPAGKSLVPSIWYPPFGTLHFPSPVTYRWVSAPCASWPPLPLRCAAPFNLW